MTEVHKKTSRLQRPQLIRHSIDLITSSQADTGAYPASPTYPPYQYSWLRDGAFIAHAMDLYGRQDSAASFHRWAAATIETHAHKVDRLQADTPHPDLPLDDRYVLHTRYTLDGREVDGEWGAFQLDGYGLWLTSLTQHLAATGAEPSPFLPAVETVTSYLTLIWHRPCYDCWEEYPTRRHSATWAAVAGGLQHASRLTGDTNAAQTADLIREKLLTQGLNGGALTKFINDGHGDKHDGRVGPQRGKAIAGHERLGRPLPPDTVDASLLFILGSFGPLPPNSPVIPATLKAIETSLIVDGGAHRYQQDEFYGGGLWPVLAAAYAALPQVDVAKRARSIAWIEDQADQQGNLPEQVSIHLLNPNHLQPWVARWGPVARPLLWSHAMYLIALSAAIAPQP